MNKTKQPIWDKNSVRLLVKNSISLLSDEEKENESKEVCRAIERMLTNRTTETLIVYKPLPDEIDIVPLVHSWRKLWREISIIEQWALLSDIPSFPVNGIIIVPWRAFTEDGKRIGRWWWFYDQLLWKNPSLQSIGVCFSCQVFPDIPEDPWDQRVSQVVFAWNILE